MHVGTDEERAEPHRETPMTIPSPTAPSRDDVVVLPTGRPPLLLLEEIAPVALDRETGAPDTTAGRRRERALLVLASGVLILPGQRARVSAWGPAVAFQIEHVVIGGRPADWLVHDLVVDGRSQFGERRRPAQIPGEVFSPPASTRPTAPSDVALALAGAGAGSRSAVPFDAARPGVCLAVVVSYVGDDDGAPLVCVLDGSIVEKTT